MELRGQGQFGGFNILASYTYSRLFGNYSGSANSDESGRQDPGVSRAFDLPYYYFNASGGISEGRLGTDRPHAFKLFAFYSFNSGLGATSIGVNQIAVSGTPDTTSVIYLSAPTLPSGRGDLGRTPMYSQTDLTLAHSFKLSGRMGLRFEANVRNLFDQDTIISRVTQLNRAGAISASRLPVAQFFQGYNPNNFVGAANPSVPLNPIYGLPGSSYRAGGGAPVITGFGGMSASSAYAARFPNFGGYQDFRTLRLGVSLTF